MSFKIKHDRASFGALCDPPHEMFYVKVNVEASVRYDITDGESFDKDSIGRLAEFDSKLKELLESMVSKPKGFV